MGGTVAGGTVVGGTVVGGTVVGGTVVGGTVVGSATGTVGAVDVALGPATLGAAKRRLGADVLTVLVGLCALLLVACGSGGGGPQAQPAPGDAVFRGGDFDQLPRYPGSGTLNQPTKKADVVAETFSVSNTTPQQISLVPCGDGPLDERL